MTLKIASELKNRRKYLQTKLWDRREQLISAYESGNQTRINRAKISLVRILRELAESPELGPRRTFDWGNLEVVYRGGFDSRICWEQCESTFGDMYKIACLLKRSVFDV